MAKGNQPRKGEVITVEVGDLAFGGKGVARVNGFVVFVEGGIPGDRAEVVLAKVRADYAEAKISKLVNPSPFRVSAPCRHFGLCGGCKWQNLDYAVQKKHKTEQLRQALRRLGGVSDPPIEPIIGAHKIYYYRNKMEFSFHAGDDGELLLGLHVGGRFRDVFQLEQCHLQSELSNEIVQFVRRRSVELGLPPYHIVKHEGYLRFLVIRQGKFTQQVLVNIVTGRGVYPALQVLAEELGSRFGRVVSISHTVNPRRANIAKGENEQILYGSDHIYERLGEKKYRISASTFFQTNSYQVQRLYDLAIELAQPEGVDRLLDLYSGAGTIAIYFSDMVREAVGVEAVREAVADAEVNARINSAKNCRFIASDVQDFLGEAVSKGERFDLVVVDPPRAGCHPDVIKWLVALKAPKLIYISCNPATLARDLRNLMQGGYVLDRAVPVDLFPHTYHIEAVCRLSFKERGL